MEAQGSGVHVWDGVREKACMDLLEHQAKPSLHDVAHDCVLDTF